MPRSSGMRRRSLDVLSPSTANDGAPDSSSRHAPPVMVRRSSRTLIACFPCRSFKRKCSGEQPCQLCKKRGRTDECKYESSEHVAPPCDPLIRAQANQRAKRTRERLMSVVTRDQKLHHQQQQEQYQYQQQQRQRSVKREMDPPLLNVECDHSAGAAGVSRDDASDIDESGSDYSGFEFDDEGEAGSSYATTMLHESTCNNSTFAPPPLPPILGQNYLHLTRHRHTVSGGSPHSLRTSPLLSTHGTSSWTSPQSQGASLSAYHTWNEHKQHCRSQSGGSGATHASQHSLPLPPHPHNLHPPSSQARQTRLSDVRRSTTDPYVFAAASLYTSTAATAATAGPSFEKRYIPPFHEPMPLTHSPLPFPPAKHEGKEQDAMEE